MALVDYFEKVKRDYLFITCNKKYVKKISKLFLISNIKIDNVYINKNVSTPLSGIYINCKIDSNVSRCTKIVNSKIVNFKG
jgi:hypothetical protein